MKLLDLPPELILQILDRASPLSCIRCRQTCHLLQKLVEEEASIQYKVELYAAGMVDSPSCNLPTSSRLDALRAYQDAWSRLKWTGELQLDFEPLTWTMVGDVLAMVDESGDFLFQTIPSTLRRQKPSRQWSFSSGTLTEHFGVDLSQNLIIFLTGVEGTNATESSVKVHIRSLEDGTLHPAARGDIPLDMPYVEGAAYAVFICGSLAIAMYMTANPMLHTTFRIFDWKSGAPITLSPKDGIEIQDLAFINERYLLLGVKEESLEESYSPTLYLLVWDLQEDCPICKLNIALPDSICLEVEWTSWGSETIAFCDDADIDSDSLHCHAFGKKLATLDIVDTQVTGTLRLFDFNRRAVLRRQYVDRDDDDDDVCVVHEDPSDFPVLIKAVSPSHLPFSQIQKKLQTTADISDAAGLVINSEAILIALIDGFLILYF